MLQETKPEYFGALDNNARRCIMLLLPLPDLLQLSATSRGHRLDLFRLMIGDLKVVVSVGEGNRAADRKASFLAFLEAGGAPLINSLELQVRWHGGPWVEQPARAWPPLQALQRLAVTCDAHLSQHITSHLTEIFGGPLIATASQLRKLRLTYPHACVSVSDVLGQISAATTSAGGSLTDITIEADTFCVDVEDGIRLLPCPPFQHLRGRAKTMAFALPNCQVDTLCCRPVSRAAMLEQRAGRNHFW